MEGSSLMHWHVLPGIISTLCHCESWASGNWFKINTLATAVAIDCSFTSCSFVSSATIPETGSLTPQFKCHTDMRPGLTSSLSQMAQS